MVSFNPVSFSVPKVDTALGGLVAKAGTAAGNAAATKVGTAMGAAVGTIIAGPVGTVVGGVVAGVVSNYIGNAISSTLTDSAYAYCFYIANDTSTVIEVDTSLIFQSQHSAYTGNISIQPQTSQQVFFSLKEEVMSVGAIPLLSINGSVVYFEFSSGVTDSITQQYINIINNPGINITVDKSYQNTATTGNYTIGVGGNGGPLISTNIWVIIANS
jgi:hypothetical protein